MRKLIALPVTCIALVANPAWAQAATSSVGPYTVGVEALAWWLKASPTPVPVITDGLYSRPGTSVLLGGGTLDTNPSAGFRINADYKVNERWGISGSFLYLGQQSTSQSVSSSGARGSTDLLLPFFDVTLGHENAVEISLASVSSGSAVVELSNSMLGADVNATWPIAATQPWDLTMLGGFRWLQLKESYTITTSSPLVPPQPADIWNTSDKFDATNNFYGAQLGVRGRYNQDRWFAAGLLKVGLGAMVQSVDVSGSLVTNDFTNFGPTQTFPGGYFALPTNSGGHSRTVFAVVPEVQLNFGYQMTPAASIYAGYNFLYASSVARPGVQINRNINPTQSVSYVGEPPVNLQGAAAPSFNFNSASFWAQGLNIGINIGF